MSVKERIAPILHNVGYHTGVSRFLARRVKLMRIIMIHGIGGPDCPEGEFIAQTAFLNRNFQVVPLIEIVRKLINPSNCTGHEVALTFDDGLRSNVTIAYPILKSMNLPATFFVCPALIEKHCWLWNQEMRARLQSMHSLERTELATMLKVSSAEVEGIVEWMKSLSLQDRLHAEDVIRNATFFFHPTLEQTRRYEIMGWDDLTSLDQKLITIGSHTMTHPILTSLPVDLLDYEIDESKRVLERKLGRQINHFCYPGGNYDGRSVEYVRKNFDSAVTTEIDFVRPGKCLHKLPRLPIAHKLQLLTWRMHRPSG